MQTVFFLGDNINFSITKTPVAFNHSITKIGEIIYGKLFSPVAGCLVPVQNNIFKQLIIMVQDKIFKLKGKVQHYVWGGTDFIPNWLGIDNPDKKPFAEY